MGIRSTLPLLILVLALSTAADIAPPDTWTALENDYYTAALEQYREEIIIYDIQLNQANPEDAAGFVLPLVLAPVSAGSLIELELPRGFEPDPAADYRLGVRYGVSGDFWVGDEVVFQLHHPGLEAEFIEITGHEYDAIIPGDEFDGGMLVIDVGGFFDRDPDDGVVTTRVFELYLVVSVGAEEPTGLDELFESLREDPPKGCKAELAMLP